MFWLMIKVFGYIIVISVIHRVLYNIYGISNPLIVEDTAHKIRSTYDSIFHSTTQNVETPTREIQNPHIVGDNSTSIADETPALSFVDHSVSSFTDRDAIVRHHGDKHNEFDAETNIQSEINEENLMNFLSKLNEDFKSPPDDTKSIISVDL